MAREWLGVGGIMLGPGYLGKFFQSLGLKGEWGEKAGLGKICRQKEKQVQRPRGRNKF